jgi:hypothetical protein
LKTELLSPEHGPADTPAPEDGGRPAHLAELSGGGWALWRTLILRGAGFPARSVLRLAAPDSAAAADRILQLEERLEAHLAAALQAVHEALDRLRRDGLWSDKDLRRPLMKAMQALTGGKLPKDVPDLSCAPSFETLRTTRDELDAAQAEFVRLYQIEVARASEEIADVARDNRFREAVLWQNRHAVETALDELAAKAAGSVARTSRRRQHEELVASYLQRYCTKNDTIGFFGPVAFSHLADEGDAISARCGADLIQQRTVYFETWCIEVLAEVLGRNPALRPWLTPRLKSSFHLESTILHRPYGKPSPLPPAQARLIARCDGRTTARDVARDLVSDPLAPFSTEEEVYRMIESLCEARMLSWALQVPPDLHPDQKLAGLLARIEPEPLRTEAMDALHELQRARDGVARAAGNPPALEAALRDLESTFTRLTGTTPRHRPGQTYAARGLVYEDCRRDADVVFGPELTRRLGPPLRLLLRSGRWLAGELARRLDLQLRALHARLSRRAGSNAVDCPTFFTSALSEIFFHRDRRNVLEEIEQELQARWSRVLGPLPANARHVRFSTHDLEGRFAAAFEDAGPTWTLTHYFSPDVMIAADGEKAFLRGDFELVLGEVHSGNTLLTSCFISQHPAPEQIHRILELDAGSSVIVVPQILQQSWPRRVSPGVNLPSWYNFHFADHLPSGPDDRRLPAGELVIEETDGTLRARTRDGRIVFHPVDLFANYLCNECSPRINDLLEPAGHMPRMSFDDLVISRERWQFTAGELELAAIRNVEDRFLALRRWAKALGLPRFCFFKTEIERKPCYLDFDSPISGDIFARFVRTARETGSEVKVTVSEMSPRLDQAWLRDGSGNLYTCELRFAALEQR